MNSLAADGTPSGVFVRDASETEKNDPNAIPREPVAEGVACRTDVVEFHQPDPFRTEWKPDLRPAESKRRRVFRRRMNLEIRSVEDGCFIEIEILVACRD